MTNPQTYNPNVIFEQNETKGGAITLKQLALTVSASAVDSVLVTGTTGKIIRVLSISIRANTATNNFSLKSKPAGASSRIFSGWAVFPSDYWRDAPVNGLCDTVSGESLTVNLGATSDMEINIRYIEFTA